jgi:hypothetical protein
MACIVVTHGVAPIDPPRRRRRLQRGDSCPCPSHTSGDVREGCTTTYPIADSAGAGQASFTSRKWGWARIKAVWGNAVAPADTSISRRYPIPQPFCGRSILRTVFTFFGRRTLPLRRFRLGVCQPVDHPFLRSNGVRKTAELDLWQIFSPRRQLDPLGRVAIKKKQNFEWVSFFHGILGNRVRNLESLRVGIPESHPGRSRKAGRVIFRSLGLGLLL